MKRYEGDLVAQPGVIYDYTEITGHLDARGADTRTAFPRLTAIGGGLYASGADTRTAFPQLAAVGGWLDAYGADTRTAFPALTSIGGDLYARGADTRTAFPALTSIGGYLYAYCADTRTAFPALTAIGGYLYASGADTRTAFPALTTVGGWLDASGADTRTAFPQLTAIGGGLYGRGGDAAFPRLTHTNDRDAARRAFRAAGYAWDDGILAEIISQRGHVTRVRIVGQTAISYLVTDGTHTAHGRTLAEARADLRIKQGPRDTTPYEAWTLDTVVTQEEAIAAYRAVTGACGAGVSAFLASRQIPARLPVRRIVEETVGAYGHEQFAAFVRSHDETPAVAAN